MRAWMLAGVLAVLGVPTAHAADEPSKTDTPAAIDVPYRLTDSQHVLVRVKLNGKGPFNFIIDTGAPAVILNESIGKKIGLKPDRDGWADFESFELEGGLKTGKTRGLVLDMFQLKGMNGMGLAGVELHGVIGYDLLARYRIRYDFTEDKLQFTPLKFNPPPLLRIGKGGGQGGMEMIGDIMKVMAPLLGIKPNFERSPRGHWGVEIDERENGVFIGRVLTGSPADKAGLKKGDQLIKVEKVDIDAVKDLVRASERVTAGKSIKVRIKRGEEESDITLATGEGL